MNAQDQLLALLSDILKSTKDFTQEQAPLLMQELLTYGMYSAILNLAFSLVFALVVAGFFVYIYRISRTCDSYSDRENYGIGLFFIAIGFMVPLACVCDSVSDIAKIKLSPRLYVIEQVTEQLKGK